MIVNFLSFQLGWFSCVLGAAKGFPWFGVIISALLIGCHIIRLKHKRHEICLIMVTLLIGLIFDLIPLELNWIEYPKVTLWPNTLPPPWMVALWGIFATTLNHSLHWLKSRVILATLSGAIFGPLAYLGAARLGALQWTNLHHALIYLMIGWALIVPLLLKLSSRFTEQILFIRNKSID
jgi:Protein of unknown function (DUF2878)